MIIRYAGQKDLPAIQNLWNISFPEEPEFSRIYFQKFFKKECALLSCKNGNICAMLQMLSYRLKMNGSIYPVYYIYGACTHPDYRRRGLMARLLEDACVLGRSRGDVASILIPQEKRLFDFYGRLGYKQGFYTQNIDLQVNEAIVNGSLEEAREEDIDQMSFLYEENTKNAGGVILRSKTYWMGQCDLFRATGGNVFCLKKDGRCMAYGFLSHSDGNLWIQEGFGESREALLCLANQVGLEHQKEIIRLSTYQVNQNSPNPFGCIKFLEGGGCPTFSGYLNLMYN